MSTGYLREWMADDAPQLSVAFRSSPDLVTQTGGADLSTVAAAQAHLEDALFSTASRRNWAIVVGGVAVGNVALTHIEHRHETAWASYWLAASARGQGFAARALAGAAEWAFADGRLFRLELGHRMNNPASCHVARRAGFVAEGIERQKLRYGDERFDVETHARLLTDPAPAIRPLPRR